jgi:HlyD family secretion protein
MITMFYNKKIKRTALVGLVAFAFAIAIASCKEAELGYDAAGAFEAEERVISAEATGKILKLDIEEGQVLDAGKAIGQIDVSNIELQKDVTASTIQAIEQKTNDAAPQIRVLEAQIATQKGQQETIQQQIAVLDKEIQRFRNLVAGHAAPQKQLDDLTGQKSVLEKQMATATSQISILNAQIAAAKSNVGTQNRGVLSEIGPTKKKVELLDKQIADGRIINDHAGTVLVKYAMDGEFTAVGKPLYKIADLSYIILRAYVTGQQLPQIKLGQKAKVQTDAGDGTMRETEGTITWISSEAEFTPKTIQTKDERANQVYAIKLRVKNDGSLKIGMYGEVLFSDNQ